MDENKQTARHDPIEPSAVELIGDVRDALDATGSVLAFAPEALSALGNSRPGAAVAYQAVEVLSEKLGRALQLLGAQDQAQSGARDRVKGLPD